MQSPHRFTRNLRRPGRLSTDEYIRGYKAGTRDQGPDPTPIYTQLVRELGDPKPQGEAQ